MPNNKPARTVADQIQLLESRGMIFQNESDAHILLKNISYYRLKGYWWDMQKDKTIHAFRPDTYFEDVIKRYNFDRKLRLILFDAIELIEISLRTKMIYILSLKHGGKWYSDSNLFNSKTNKKTCKTLHQETVDKLKSEFNRSQESFIKDHKKRYPNDSTPDAWKMLEVASMGILSRLYKGLNDQSPEKATIAKEMGLNSHKELSSWLEAITYIRNIIAHHSRLWSRNMVKSPKEKLNNPIGQWLTSPILPVQKKKVYLIICCMIYLCNHINPNHDIKDRIIDLFKQFSSIEIYKLGFLNNWDKEPIWCNHSC
ncbi:MAG: Abi family protein [Bacteroidales bacterium]